MTEEKGLTKRNVLELAKSIEINEGGILLKTAQDAMQYADWSWQSGFLPDQITNAKQAFAIMARGAELGLKPYASWKWIYMTKNRKLSMETLGKLAVCQASPVYAGYDEYIENEQEPPQMWKAVAIAKRKGVDPVRKTFSYQDAETGGLLEKKRSKSSGSLIDGPYQKFLKDMLLSRARGRALDVQFADVLGGIPSREIEDNEAEQRRKDEGIRSAPPEVTVSDPLLDELSGPAPPAEPVIDAETREVIDGQVDEVFSAEDVGLKVVENGQSGVQKPEKGESGPQEAERGESKPEKRASSSSPFFEPEVELPGDKKPPPAPKAPEKPDGATAQACNGCGVLYHISRTACPECGVKSGEKLPPPEKEDGLTSAIRHDKEPNPFERGRKKVQKARKGQGSLLDK